MLERQPHRAQLAVGCNRVAIIDDAARDVEMGDGVAVKQDLLMRVIKEQRRDRERGDDHGQARFVALLDVSTRQSRLGYVYGHLCAP